MNEKWLAPSATLEQLEMWRNHSAVLPGPLVAIEAKDSRAVERYARTAVREYRYGYGCSWVRAARG
jgi:hypothetical protein